MQGRRHFLALAAGTVSDPQLISLLRHREYLEKLEIVVMRVDGSDATKLVWKQVVGCDARVETRSAEMNIMRCSMDQRYTTTGLLLLFAWAAVAQTPAPGAREIRVTPRGTSPIVGRAGTSTLVEAGPERFLIDAGSGALERLVRAGFLLAPA